MRCGEGLQCRTIKQDGTYSEGGDEDGLNASSQSATGSVMCSATEGPPAENVVPEQPTTRQAEVKCASCHNVPAVLRPARE